jgi:hypothetical protein
MSYRLNPQNRVTRDFQGSLKKILKVMSKGEHHLMS